MSIASSAAIYTSEADARASGTTDVDIWLAKIEAQINADKDWREEARVAVAVYEATRKVTGLPGYSGRPMFNIFHSNIETLCPAVFNSTPIPDVRRKFGDRDPQARLAAQIAERALGSCVDGFDFDGVMRRAVRSACVPGRGVTRARYVPYLKTTQDVDGTEYEAVDHEEATLEHVGWDRYVEGPARDWSMVPWLAFPHDLTKDEVERLIADQKDADKRLALLSFSDNGAENDQENEKISANKGILRTLPVWEIWDKTSRKVIFITEKDRTFPLAVVDDPLKLSKFFPIPEPLQQTRRESSRVPMCPHNIYADLVAEIDDVTIRIKATIDDMRVRAISDPKFDKDLEALKAATDGDVISSSTAELFTSGQPVDISKLVMWWPIEKDVAILQRLMEHRENLKQVIYEVTGLSDILRGATNANETAKAQEIKATWGSQRVQELQAEVARYAKDCFRLLAEVIFNKFQDDTIRNMVLLPEPVDAGKIAAAVAKQFEAQAAQSGVIDIGANGGPPLNDNEPPQSPENTRAANANSANGVPPVDPNALAMAQQQAIQQAQQQAEQEYVSALQIMRSQLRYFRVDIETDSTIKANLSADQAQVTNFVGMTGQYWQATAGLATVAPQMLPYMVEIWAKIATKSYKLGKGADDIMEKLVDAAHEAAANAGQAQQGPSPEEIAMQQAQQQHEKELQDKDQAHAAAIQASTHEREQGKFAHDQTIAEMTRAQAQAQAEHDAVQAQQNREHEQLMAAHDHMMAQLEVHSNLLDHAGKAKLLELKQIGDQMKARHQADMTKNRALPPKGGAAAQ